MYKKKVLGVSSFCAVLSACGGGLPTGQTKDSPSGGTTGTPALQLQIDQYNSGTWTDVNLLTTVTVNCVAATSDYKFRLLNNGTGSLTGSGPVVTLNQNTSGTSFVFSSTQPSMPVAASSSEEFTVRLSGGADCEHLTGNGGGFYGDETSLVTVDTNDPTNPSYEVTIQVLGHS